MRLIFVRHGDPDYEHDSVTPKGRREIALLAGMLRSVTADAVCLSPLGRAQETARATLALTGQEGTTYPWLREFDTPLSLPGTGEKHLFWDFLPSFLEEHPALYDAQAWRREPFVAESAVPQKYDEVCAGLDALLASHGYVREGRHYRVVRENKKTLLFFCHFGVTGILLSHLFGIAPVPLLQHFIAAPTSVTTLRTEEREQGIASFRCAAYGDVSHLYAAQEPPAFSGRFCEVFSDFSERH